MNSKIFCLLIIAIFISGCTGNDSNVDDTNNDADITPSTTLKKTATTIKQQAGNNAPSPTSTTLSAPAAGGPLSDLHAAINSGGSYICKFMYNGVESDSWINGEMFKYKTEVNGMDSYSLSDGEWAYGWIGGQNSGIKFKLSDLKELQEKGQSGAGFKDMSYVANLAAEIDCQPSVIPDETFKAPQNITFTDFGELMKNMPSA